MYAGAILMDLSKAFDCLPHDLLCEKLVAYGLDQNSVKLIQNYLSSRKQYVNNWKLQKQFYGYIKWHTPGINSQSHNL